jgi:arylsulfatase A
MKATSRRDFLKALAVGAAATLAPEIRAQVTAARPNVLVILSDDQGTLDLNSYGSADLHTPNLDALANRGVRFTQFYAGSSVCSPSRAAFLTGRYPHRAGVPGNAESRPEHFGSGHGLAEEQVTIAEVLRSNGYRTGQFGKWHLGSEPGPNKQGFDEAIGFLGGCIDKWSHYNYGGVPWGASPKRHDWHRNGKEVWESGIHSGDLIVREAGRFIEKEPAKPFFAYVAFGTPHYPMQPYDKYRIHYEDLPEPRRSYAALVSTMDEQVGRLLAKVEGLGLMEKTLVIFQADQGHSTEARGNYGGGNTGPYRGAKASLLEGGLRVPAIVSLPGRLPGNAVRGQMCSGCDWFPTIADLCGIPLPKHTVDGKSLVGVIQSEDAPAPHAVWHWMLGRQWAVRDGIWKLIANGFDTTDGRDKQKLPAKFLVNLADDPGERSNLADKHPDIVKRLTRLHEEWAMDVHGAR